VADQNNVMYMSGFHSWMDIVASSNPIMQKKCMATQKLALKAGNKTCMAIQQFCRSVSTGTILVTKKEQEQERNSMEECLNKILLEFNILPFHGSLISHSQIYT
jgi:hypothetical protein